MLAIETLPRCITEFTIEQKRKYSHNNPGLILTHVSFPTPYKVDVKLEHPFHISLRTDAHTYVHHIDKTMVQYTQKVTNTHTANYGQRQKTYTVKLAMTAGCLSPVPHRASLSGMEQHLPLGQP